MNVIKNSVHQQIRKDLTLQRYERMNKQYGENYKVEVRVEPETGRQAVYVMEKDGSRLVAYEDDYYQLTADYDNNTLMINGKKVDIVDGHTATYSDDYYPARGYNPAKGIKLEATFDLKAGKLINETMTIGTNLLSVKEENGIKYAMEGSLAKCILNPDGTVTDISETNLYADYDNKVAFIDGKEATMKKNVDGTMTISNSSDQIVVSGDDSHKMLSHNVTTQSGDVFEIVFNANGKIDFATSKINGQSASLAITRNGDGSETLTMNDGTTIHETTTQIMDEYSQVTQPGDWLGSGNVMLPKEVSNIAVPGLGFNVLPVLGTVAGVIPENFFVKSAFSYDAFRKSLEIARGLKLEQYTANGVRYVKAFGKNLPTHLKSFQIIKGRRYLPTTSTVAQYLKIKPAIGSIAKGTGLLAVGASLMDNYFEAIKGGYGFNSYYASDSMFDAGVAFAAAAAGAITTAFIIGMAATATTPIIAAGFVLGYVVNDLTTRLLGYGVMMSDNYNYRPTTIIITGKN